MLKLIDAEETYLSGYKEAYFLSLREIEKGTMKKHNFMFDDPNKVDIVQKYRDNRDRSKLKPKYVPSYDYFLVDDDKFIGTISIRIELTPALLNYGGNIGYGVNPKYWNVGYGTRLLALGLQKAKELVQQDQVLITCDDDNVGSYKIIEKNGGILENKLENTDAGETFLTRRYWIAIR